MTRFRKHKSWKTNLLFSIVFHVLVLKTLALFCFWEEGLYMFSDIANLGSPLKIWQRIRVLFKLENVLWAAV